MDLGKQIGPLPLGAWIVVVGVGVGIAYYSYRKNQTAQPVMIDRSTDPGVGEGPGGFTTVNPSGSSTSGEQQITTNDEWTREAINYLIAQGYDPGLSNQAISRYINGVQPDIRDQSLIDIALRHLHAPPIPPPAVTNVPTVPAPTGNAPGAVTGFHAYSVGKVSIAVTWNGVQNTASYQLFVNGRARTIVTGGTRKTTLYGFLRRHTYTIGIRAMNTYKDGNGKFQIGFGPTTTIRVTTK